MSGFYTQTRTFKRISHMWDHVKNVHLGKVPPKSGLSRTILYKGSRVGSQQRDAFQKSRGHGTSSTPDLEFSLIEFSSCEFFASLRPDWALNGFTTGNGGGLVGRAPSKPD
jgi:hypothetical protein